MQPSLGALICHAAGSTGCADVEIVMPKSYWFERTSPAFRLMIATSWLAPESWRARQDETVRQVCATGMDWAEYLRLVHRHRTPALSWAVLKRVQNVEMPEQIAQELRRVSDLCRMKAMLHSQVLAGILKGFNRAGIPVMPLKGTLLSLQMYGDPGLRQSKDLDILVAHEYVLQAQKCLEAMGWCRSAEYSSLTPRQSEFNLRYEHHIGFTEPRRGTELELHWRTGWDTPELAEGRLARSIESEWQGCSYLAMDPMDLMLYLCNHGSDHAWVRAKWLGDLARMFTAESVDWNAASDEGWAVLLCLCLLKDAYGLPTLEASNRPTKDMPPVLINKAVRELTADAEPTGRAAPARLFEEIRSYDYKHQLWPYRSRSESIAEVAVCRVDFRVLALPDSLFWLYIPLRPFLWAWRHLKDFRPQL